MTISSPFPWICPVCQQALTAAQKSWRCANNHGFDVAKSGYVNLLLPNQKGSQAPGDSDTMLKARKAFLTTGHFDPVVHGLAEVICAAGQIWHECEKSPGEVRSPQFLLDIGCGEGYYLDRLMLLLPDYFRFAGIDIAKEGLQLAARRNSKAQWVCASNARLPLAEQSVDVITRIFAPSTAAELQRVLKPGGLLVIASPGARHLFELRQALYENVTLHEKVEPPKGFSLVAENESAFSLELDNSADIAHLLMMTPFFWRGKQAGRERLMELTRLQVEVHIHFCCFQRD